MHHAFWLLQEWMSVEQKPTIVGDGHTYFLKVVAKRSFFMCVYVCVCVCVCGGGEGGCYITASTMSLISTVKKVSSFFCCSLGYDSSWQYYGLNWKSLTQPAILPLFTDYIPSVGTITNTYKRKYHKIGVSEITSQFDSVLAYCQEMVRQRLAQEYQVSLSPLSPLFFFCFLFSFISSLFY